MFRIKIRTFLTKLKGISVFLKCIFQLLENPKKSKKIRIRAKSGRRFALFFYHHRLVSLHVFAEQFLQRRSPSIRKHYDSKKPFPIMVLDAVKSGWYMIFKASSTMRRLCSPPNTDDCAGAAEVMLKGFAAQQNSLAVLPYAHYSGMVLRSGSKYGIGCSLKRFCSCSLSILAFVLSSDTFPMRI